jgi:hypothetical protein
MTHHATPSWQGPAGWPSRSDGREAPSSTMTCPENKGSAAVISKLDEMIGEGLVTTEEVRIVISRP